jgi:general transcription factor 3C polypeptide 3 (transcription factor C subunit 4)
METASAGFALLEILVLPGLCGTFEEHERAIDVFRKGCRWLQGRAAESAWDACADDRELDCADADVVRDAADNDLEPGYFELDVNASNRLAVARIKMGEIEEGKVRARPDC